MKFRLLGIYSSCAILLIFTRCANPLSLSGGEKDTQAPQIQNKHSTPNFQTNSQLKEIKLCFDEWIQLKDPIKNINISPLTQLPLETQIKGKCLITKLHKDELLKENTTYIIKYNNAIVDFTENNSMQDFQMVFSTGNYLDSLIITGTVKDIQTQKPAIKAMVVLYDNVSDTAFQKLKPLYYTWTDSAGIFKLDYLKPNVYKLYALNDKNQNYYFDQKLEEIARYYKPVELNKSITLDTILELSLPLVPPVLLEQSVTNGSIVLNYSKTIIDATLSSIPQSNVRFFQESNVLKVWPTASTEQKIIISYSEKSDTLSFKNIEDTITHPKLFILSQAQPSTKFGLLQAICNYALDTIIQSRVTVFDSTNKTQVPNTVFSKTSNPSVLECKAAFIPGNKYSIYFQDSCYKDIKGRWNTAHQEFCIMYDPNKFSNAIIQIDSSSKQEDVIIELIQNNKSVWAQVIKAENIFDKIRVYHVPPGTYQLHVVHDSNKNGVWDGIQYESNINPERIQIIAVPDLRAGWDMELNVKL